MVTAVKFIDKYLGAPICSFLALFRKKKWLSAGYKRILVVQLWGIGETILVLPSVEALRKNFPKADIDVFESEAENQGAERPIEDLEKELEALTVLTEGTVSDRRKRTAGERHGRPAVPGEVSGKDAGHAQVAVRYRSAA